MLNQTTKIIIGANSGIAKALALQLIKEKQTQLIVITRDISFYQQSKFEGCQVIAVDNYQDITITRAVEHIREKLENAISSVFICHGLLHNSEITPEKRLQEFSELAFLEVIKANAMTPILWLKQLLPLLKSKIECKVVIFTARVGSISDNGMGGWYSYRASKAAANMLIKSAAIEFKRSAKNIKLISFHPGTTDTPLSEPFQKNVPEHKLFNSDFVASQLLQIVKKATIDGEASFLDWQGKSIPW